MLRALEYVAPTVMAALVISMMTSTEGKLTAGWAELLGLLLAATVAKFTGNHILSLLVGMGSFWAIRWIM
jgi:branched-subunit amino acid transport protein